MKPIISFCLFIVFLFLGANIINALNLPNYSARVNDFAGIFSPEYKNQLENRLAKIETDTTNEVAVVSVNSLEGTTIEDYSEQLFQYWGIGKKGQDNGLLLLIAPNEREVRFEVGYGLEPIITDGRAGEIIRNQITPNFKNSNYEQGVWQAMDKIESYLRGEPNFKAKQPSSSFSFTEAFKDEKFSTRLFYIFVIGSAFLPYLIAFWSRSKSIYGGGITGGLVGFYLGNAQSILMAIFLSLSLGFVGLLLDFILSQNYQRRKKLGLGTDFWSSGGGFWSGGSHRGGGGGGGGFGGFGGGSSGGGGASGKW